MSGGHPNISVDTSTPLPEREGAAEETWSHAEDWADEATVESEGSGGDEFGSNGTGPRPLAVAEGEDEDGVGDDDDDAVWARRGQGGIAFDHYDGEEGAAYYDEGGEERFLDSGGEEEEPVVSLRSPPVQARGMWRREHGSNLPRGGRSYDG